MTKAVHGIYAAAISPFQKDGSLDAAKLVRYCQYLTSEGGCDGVAPLGTTGEGNSISFRQKLDLPGVFAEAGFDPKRAIFGTGACATQDAIDLTKATLKSGFQNVLVLPPFYYKTPGSDGLYRYFAELIEAVGDARLRLYLYHFPQMSMTPIPVEVVTRLKSDFGATVAGLKDSSGDMTQALAFVEATGGVSADFDVYPSSEVFLFEGLARGCAGVISGSTNAFGRYVKAALADGAESAAFERVKKARATASAYPLMAAMKQIEAWRSNDDDWTRMAPPLDALSDEQKESLKAEIQSLNT